jgi:hypothetical protein
VIDRLVRGIRELSALAPDELAAPTTARARADCADALRLELDCPQQSLSSRERDALRRLDAELEAPAPNGAALAAAIRAARDALGLDAFNRE